MSFLFTTISSSGFAITKKRLRTLILTVTLASSVATKVDAEVTVGTAKNGNVPLRGIPKILPEIVWRLTRYQIVRREAFRDWTKTL